MHRGKNKVKGSVKKRFRLTASGKVKRKKANHSHILTKKNAKRKNHLLSPTYLGPADEKRIKELMG